MSIKSSNTKGNPYHDEATGEFTSADSSNSKTESNINGFTPPTITPNNLSPNNSPNNPPTLKSKFKLKGNVDEIRQNLKESNQVSSIPFLTSARDIEEHLEEFFTPSIIKNIDSKFGKFKIEYKYFNLRTDPEQRCGVNIFAACIGKKRWNNNYLKLIDTNEYLKLLGTRGFTRLHRGIKSGDDETFKTIADSYSSKENEMIYGSVGGTCYGIAVYASNIENEAVAYANYNKKHVMNLVLDKKGKTMSYGKICQIRDDFYRNKSSIVQKVENIFVKNGIESSRAKKMATSFGYTMDDEGFIAMLCGVEWYNSGSYHMIENLGTMYRVLE